MSYFVYYNKEENGSIVGVSPAELKELAGTEYLLVSEKEAMPFISGKEKITKWKVDTIKNPTLVKKDNHVFHRYNEHGFFDVSTQLTNKPIITIEVKQKVIIITSNQHSDFITFYLTKKDNPSYLLQKMTLEPNVVEKRFVADEENFSIFATSNYGHIKYVASDQ